MVVLDASAAVHAATPVDGFSPLASEELVAPPLLWSEVLSAIHQTAWRGDISSSLAAEMVERLLSAPIDRRHHPDLYREAWSVADELGWAKTYDAEYVALARLLDSPLLTADGRLRRGAARLITVIGPEDL